MTFNRDENLSGDPDPIEYTVEALNGAESLPAEIEITFVANPYITDVSNANACTALGGTLTGANVYTPFDNGTFGTGSGAQFSPASNPYATAINGTYAQYVTMRTRQEWRCSFVNLIKQRTA